MTILQTKIAAARRRMIFSIAAHNSATGALLGALLYVAGAAVLVNGGAPPWHAPLGLACVTVGAAFAVIATWRQRPDSRRAACLLDRRGQTLDRFLTGLSLDQCAAPLERLARTECERYSAAVNVRTLIPVRMPPRLLALAAPAVALVMLHWHHTLASRPDPAAAMAREELLQKAERLEQLERELADQADTPELKKLAREMREAAEKLRTAAQAGDADARAALRELSALEGLIAAMERALESAAREMERVAAEIDKNAPDAKNMAQQLPAAEALSPEQQHALERALSEASQAQTAADPSGREKALQRLAEQLRQLAQQSRQGQGRQTRQLRAMKAALQDIKFGREGDRSQPENSTEGNRDQPMMVDLSGGKPGDSGMLALDIPSGEAGSELDQGTSETPLGETATSEQPQGHATQLQSVLGEGESLLDLVPAAGDTSKSTRRYRELYNAIAGASQDTVEREEIPLASRFYIKRYFEFIRPTD